MRDLSELGIYYEKAVAWKAPAIEADILTFEKKYGVSLPADYIRFLSVYNGGSPRLNWIEANNTHYAFQIETFYHLSCDETESYSVSEASKRPSQELGRPVIAIAGDGGGDQLIFDPTGGTTEVKWWTHDEDVEPVVIAGSFGALLDQLIASPYADEV